MYKKRIISLKAQGSARGLAAQTEGDAFCTSRTKPRISHLVRVQEK